MSLLIELPRYVRSHPSGEIQALKIAHTIPNPRGIELHFDNQRYAPIQVDAAWFDKQKVESGGYLVIYESGVRSFWPAALFELAHVEVSQ